MIRCPFCGKETNSGLSNCAHCGGPLQSFGTLSPPKPGPRPHVCPNCGGPVQPEDIICLACGTNLLTGQKVIMEGKAPKKAGGGGLRAVWTVLGVLLLVAVLGGGGFLAMRLLKNPVESAKQLAAQGKVPEALSTLQAHVERKPADREARVLQGKLFWQGQQFAKAADAMEAAYKLDTKNIETGFMAVVAAGRLAGDDGLKKQTVILREILTNSPGDPHAMRLLAMTLGALGDFSAQDTLCQDARDLPALAADAALPTTFGVGRALQHGLPEAEEMLRKARAAAPESGDAAAALGFVLNLEGQSDAAEEALAKAIELNTSVAGMAKMQLGMLYLQTGKNEKALAVFNGAKAELKDDPRLPFYTALALELTGLGTEALVEYERISTTGSKFAGPAALQMAGLYVRQNLPDKALNAVRRATELGLSSARLFTVQGQVQAQQGTQAEAEQSYRRAIQTDANYPGAHLELGLMLVSRNAVADGIRELERFLELTADKAAGTPRRNEIEVLVNQLKQTQKTS